MSRLDNRKAVNQHDVIRYVDNGLFRIHMSKFLYNSSYDEYDNKYGDYIIGDVEDMINLDVTSEFLMYHKDQFYMFVQTMFNSDVWCRCQQGREYISDSTLR
jgi:hypothetical protein